jgi:hypothetical protein
MLPSKDTELVACLYACLNSFVFDYCSRQKVGGTNLKYFTMRQLPVLPPEKYEQQTPWNFPQLLKSWVLPRVLELTYTSWDLQSFAEDCAYSGPPFCWSEERRLILRAELDAAYFHLYGIGREDADYILETFPIVRRHTEKRFDEYKTKRVILEIYDEIAKAIQSQKPYQTRLFPPPADASIAHELR